MSAGWTAGPVGVGGDMVVLGQYRPDERWNGFLCPRLDPYGVEAIMWALRAAYDAGADPYYPVHEWHGDVLLLTETSDGDDHYTERIEPDEDGLYALGAYGWVWVAEPDVDPYMVLIRRYGWTKTDEAMAGGVLLRRHFDLGEFASATVYVDGRRVATYKTEQGAVRGATKWASR